MPPITVNATGILKLISNLKLSSSAGRENINLKILKNTAVISSKLLHLSFNLSLSESRLHSAWKIDRVVQIYKQGIRSLTSNYRPLSLTTVSSKLLKHIMYSHTITHLSQHDFLFRHQHGFRKGLSCNTQLSEFVHELHTSLECHAQTDAIFLDFSKAFDRVPLSVFSPRYPSWN